MKPENEMSIYALLCLAILVGIFFIIFICIRYKRKCCCKTTEDYGDIPIMDTDFHEEIVNDDEEYEFNGGIDDEAISMPVLYREDESISVEERSREDNVNTFEVQAEVSRSEDDETGSRLCLNLPEHVNEQGENLCAPDAEQDEDFQREKISMDS